MNLAGPHGVLLLTEVDQELPEERAMSTSRTETVPDTWDESRDVPFFRITCHLFSPRFCLGASTLLAANDDVEPVPAAVGARRSAPTLPA